ncbi:MAG: helical backbone metal receptor [Bdellovibrionales bacterium]
MKVVCLVPSITETLIECGVEVIGRTRYCIHPAQKVDSIPIIGGTKKVDFDKLSEKPDFVVVDKEENTLETAQSCPFPLLIVHVESLDSLEKELRTMAEKLNCTRLTNLATKLNTIRGRKYTTKLERIFESDLSKLNLDQPWVYCIWKNPWMAVGQNTFIYDMFTELNLEKNLIQFEEKYPKFEYEKYKTEANFLLSSEPYPFAKEKEILRQSNAILIDGENWSWFGVRSIRFLEHLSIDL